MIPLPSLDSVCAYTFNAPFQTLNGIYAMKEIISFSDALDTGIDFIANLYTPAGVATSQYATDAVNYKNNPVIYLVPVNGTGSSLYVPASLLETVPDQMVGCYNDLAIGISLGVFADQTKLQWVLDEINAILGGTVGVASQAKLYSLGVKYMSITDYEAIQAARATPTPYTTIYQQLQQQIVLTEKAQALNRDYEHTLISLSITP